MKHQHFPLNSCFPLQIEIIHSCTETRITQAPLFVLLPLSSNVISAMSSISFSLPLYILHVSHGTYIFLSEVDRNEKITMIVSGTVTISKYRV